LILIITLCLFTASNTHCILICLWLVQAMQPPCATKVITDLFFWSTKGLGAAHYIINFRSSCHVMR
jgi:hypothetical protein